VLNRSLKKNHDVVAVTSAKAALAKIESGENFDLIVCDLMMPEMSGMDFYERLSESHPDKAKQIVFLSGGAFTQSARAFLERVPNARLEKPFEARTLLAIIEERLRQAAREPERR
jgi:CheY-like chemotaxis protein